jgi:hypothetical protein
LNTLALKGAGLKRFLPQEEKEKEKEKEKGKRKKEKGKQKKVKRKEKYIEDKRRGKSSKTYAGEELTLQNARFGQSHPPHFC